MAHTVEEYLFEHPGGSPRDWLTWIPSGDGPGAKHRWSAVDDDWWQCRRCGAEFAAFEEADVLRTEYHPRPAGGQCATGYSDPPQDSYYRRRYPSGEPDELPTSLARFERGRGWVRFEGASVFHVYRLEYDDTNDPTAGGPAFRYQTEVEKEPIIPGHPHAWTFTPAPGHQHAECAGCTIEACVVTPPVPGRVRWSYRYGGGVNWESMRAFGIEPARRGSSADRRT